MAMKPKSRWVVLVGAAMCGAITASLNCYSIFQKPMMAEFGWSPQIVALAYTLAIVVIGFAGGPIGGWFQRKFAAHKIMLVSGIVFGIGWILTGFSTNPIMLLITFGIIVGFADGIIYNTSFALTTRWFPDKKGLVNGISLATMALWPLWTAPVGNMIVQAIGPMPSFMVVGAFSIVMFLIFSWLCYVLPPADYQPEGWNPPVDEEAKNRRSYTTPEMMKTPLFWIMVIVFALTACTGVFMLGTASLVGQTQAGMDAATGAMMVSIFAVANAAGRFGFGTLSDKIGRFQTLFIVISITAVIHLFLYGNTDSTMPFIIESIVLGMCFGGIMAIMPSLTGDAFGPANMGQNYGFMYWGYALAAVIGPMLSANTLATTGSYSTAFPILGVLCIIAIILLAIGMPIYNKMKARDAAMMEAKNAEKNA